MLIALLLLATPAVAKERLSLIKACETSKGIVFQGGGYGGISGVDYDPRTKLWAFISDDKSEHGPSHYFLGRLDVRPDQPCGRCWRRWSRCAARTARPSPIERLGPRRPDGESIRFDPLNRDLVWATEGDFDHGYPPAARRMKPDGTSIERLAVPQALTSMTGARPARARTPRSRA
jgi:hypothetical protein